VKPYDADEEDLRHDAAVQREIDERADMAVRLAAAKRAASGISTEEMSMQDAFREGTKAGGQGFGASMNPYQDATPEHAEWNRGRLSAIGQANSRRVA
jgi:hypothetical protein